MTWEFLITLSPPGLDSYPLGFCELSQSRQQIPFLPSLVRCGLWCWPSRVLTSPPAEDVPGRGRASWKQPLPTWTGDSLHSLHLTLFQQSNIWTKYSFYILVPIKATHHSCLRPHSSRSFIIINKAFWLFLYKKEILWIHALRWFSHSPTSCAQLCQSVPHNESSWGHFQDGRTLGSPWSLGSNPSGLSLSKVAFQTLTAWLPVPDQPYHSGLFYTNIEFILTALPQLIITGMLWLPICQHAGQLWCTRIHTEQWWAIPSPTGMHQAHGSMAAGIKCLHQQIL